MGTSKTIKARAFAFIIYEDSWPTWKRNLEHLHMPVVVSPLHDKDVTEDGAPKKPHRHAIISWPNPTTINNAITTLSQFGISYVEPVGSYQGYCRYLIHLDNPEKAQYNAADIVCLNNAVVDLERKLTRSETREMRQEILKFCRDNGITEYAVLLDIAGRYSPDWFDDVDSRPNFWSAYFRSVRGMSKAEAERQARNNPAE